MTRSKPADEQPEPAPPASPSRVPAPEPAPLESAEDGTRFEPYPGAGFFHGGRYSPVNAVAGARLTAEGHAPAGKVLGPDWTTAHRDAWQAYQRSLRPKGGGDTSGIPDESAWRQLKVPRVSPLPKES